jgi:hypothetical protein
MDRFYPIVIRFLMNNFKKRGLKKGNEAKKN